MARDCPTPFSLLESLGARPALSRASVEPSGYRGLGNTLERLHEGRHPKGHALVAVDGPDLLERIGHLPVEPHVDLLLVPLEVLKVLHPLEEAHGDAAGVAEDVRQDGNAPLPKDDVALRRDGPVGGLSNELAPEITGVLLGDDASDRRGHQHIARRGEHLQRIERLPAGELAQLVTLCGVRPQGPDVEAGGVVDAAVGIAHGNDLPAALRDELRRPRAHVAKALERKGVPVDPRSATRLEHLADGKRDAAARRRLAPEGAVEEDRLPSDRSGCKSLILAVLIVEPRHDPPVGVHVWGRNICKRPNYFSALLDETPGKFFKLPLA
mmetsp:Transcript_17264/g.41236  ORF Transcript_17264/g.41236 Transcript_17264/m.41236 type:complete len:325 (-) Transcript_17264:609-1583(-)